jgi:hypothetical protein
VPEPKDRNIPYGGCGYGALADDRF